MQKETLVRADLDAVASAQSGNWIFAVARLVKGENTMSDQDNSEPTKPLNQRVLEHLSTQGITIISSKTLPSGLILHDCSETPGATIFSQPSRQKP